MGSLTITSDRLQVRFTRFEKLAGLLRDVDIPLTEIRSCTAIRHGFTAVRGSRRPGFDLPGRLKVGTWWRGGQRTVVCVRRGEPALHISVRGHDDPSWLIGTPEAAQLAQELAAWAGPGPGSGA